MTAPARPLFMMTQRNLETNEHLIVYGHATANVMTEFWEAYAKPGFAVEIQQLTGSMMSAVRHPADGLPTTPKLTEIMPGDGTSHMLEVAYVSDFPRNKDGLCVFCEGDPCAEEESAPQRIKDYYTKNASWARTCPICDGRPS